MSKERVPVRYWSEYLPTLKQKGVNEALSSVFFRSAPLNRWFDENSAKDSNPVSHSPPIRYLNLFSVGKNPVLRTVVW